MKTYPSKQVKNNFGAVMEDAQRHPVQLTKNGRLVGGIVNQEIFEKVLRLEHAEAQKHVLQSVQKMQSEASQKTKPTLSEMQDLLQCDSETIDELFGDDFFSSHACES